ncbi:chemotaxis protein CheW [Motiliproteus coralliicola]|uniref:Chemotaxis protein CheW n=1 Tax=Motiliproteus coralliicola TaxID=2283196 RepID=A0A369WPE0_9GAMM|nr:chemotaxis protein CheW [Motiliproteus coralliicola]RDE22436.1 chemotaxis protein CheW [Motiliproteus coralliicola]
MKTRQPLSPQPAAESDIATAAQTRTQTKGPQVAVQEYLDALLQDATSQAIVEDQQLEVLMVPELAPVAPVVIEPELVETVAEVKPAVEQQQEQDLDELTAAGVDEPEADLWVEGRPPWAQQRFDCLLFKVAGLMLAVPLVELGGVLVIEDELRPLFGQPDWFLGLLPSKTEGTVKAIDTARWVMPERYPEDAGEFKYVILMEGSDWGMACHEVADAVTLEPDQVSWRSDRGRRPWLAGTVIDHMCAIMDVSALLNLLQQSQAEQQQTHSEQ